MSAIKIAFTSHIYPPLQGATNHFLKMRLFVLWLDRSVFCNALTFSASTLKDFLCFLAKCRFILDVWQKVFGQQCAYTALSSRDPKPKSSAKDSRNNLTTNFTILQVTINYRFHTTNQRSIYNIMTTTKLPQIKHPKILVVRCSDFEKASNHQACHEKSSRKPLVARVPGFADPCAISHKKSFIESFCNM